MTDSIFMTAMEALRDRIRGLSLEDLSTDEVAVRRLPHDGEHMYRGVTIHPVTESYDQGTNERENVGYGCAVTMVVNNDNQATRKLDLILKWREEIRREFVEDASLTGVSTTCTLKVEHGYPIDWDALFDKNYDVSRLVIRVFSLETRT